MYKFVFKCDLFDVESLVTRNFFPLFLPVGLLQKLEEEKGKKEKERLEIERERRERDKERERERERRDREKEKERERERDKERERDRDRDRDRERDRERERTKERERERSRDVSEDRSRSRSVMSYLMRGWPFNACQGTLFIWHSVQVVCFVEFFSSDCSRHKQRRGNMRQASKMAIQFLQKDFRNQSEGLFSGCSVAFSHLSSYNWKFRQMPQISVVPCRKTSVPTHVNLIKWDLCCKVKLCFWQLALAQTKSTRLTTREISAWHYFNSSHFSSYQF